MEIVKTHKYEKILGLIWEPIVSDGLSSVIAIRTDKLNVNGLKWLVVE